MTFFLSLSITANEIDKKKADLIIYDFTLKATVKRVINCRYVLCKKIKI